MFDKQGQVDQIAFESKPGISPAATRAEVNDALAGHADEVQTAEGADPFDFKGLKSFVTFIKIFLLAFAGIALFVGAFIIFNTFAITVAQRTREFALLRTIGASRRQVLRSVVLEAFIIGLAATIVGAGLGVLIAKFLNAVMKAAEIDLPQAGMVFSLRTVLVSLLVGVVVTVAGQHHPGGARDARARPWPCSARARRCRSRAFRRRRRSSRSAAAGGGFALLLFGMFGHGGGAFVHVLAIAGGTLALFIGVALLAPRLVRPIAWAVGAPAARFAGAPGRLARENATRNPGRTAVTASALMIGLALVTFVTVLAQGIRSSWGSTVRKQVSADYILTTTLRLGLVLARRGGGDRAHAGRRGGLERPERTGQARQIAVERLGPRHGDGAALLPLHVGRRLERDAREAREQRRDRARAASRRTITCRSASRST